MRFLYTIGIYLYGLIIWLAARFNPKAKLWIQGRKNWEYPLETANLEGCFWIHCASLGEFEQGRPVIEALRKIRFTRPIVLSFFSPSGYEIRKNYPLADKVIYLPLDTPSNARRFLELTRPSLAVFVKYEVWHNMFAEIHQRRIPLLLISSIFRENQIYFKPYGTWFKRSLNCITEIFTQDDASKSLLMRSGIKHVTVAGDTRFDRVLEIANSAQSFDELIPFRKKNLVVVAGSTWPADEELLIDYARKHPQIHFIIAPHETHAAHIDKIRAQFPEALTWSEKKKITEETRVVIIDTIGLLSSLYKYADIAYVGGGFGTGIHNTLEPAVFAAPVVFGPRYQKFREARELITFRGAQSVSTATEFLNAMDSLTTNFDLRKTMGTNAGNYVANNAGATAKILEAINDRLSS